MSQEFQIELINDFAQWDEIVNSLEGHPLQLANWGELKSKSQWSANRLLITKNKKKVAAVQILTRKLPFPFRAISHIPRGPAFEKSQLKNKDTEKEVLNLIGKWIKSNLNSIAVICEPDYFESEFAFGKKWSPSKTPILFNKTLIINLNQNKDELYSNLNRKNRNHIRHAEKEGVQIRIAKTRDDVKEVLAVYKEVAARAGFLLHSDEYFYNAFNLNIGPLYIGSINGKAVNFLWQAHSNNLCFELWGGAAEKGQSTFANNAIKWFAMLDMKEKGVSQYDMNGLLNQGIANFKRSFEKREDNLISSHTLALSPFYHLYTIAYKLLRFIKNAFKK